MVVLPSVPAERSRQAFLPQHAAEVAVEATWGFGAHSLYGIQVSWHKPLPLLVPPANGSGREPGILIVRGLSQVWQLVGLHRNMVPWVVLCVFPVKWFWGIPPSAQSLMAQACHVGSHLILPFSCFSFPYCLLFLFYIVMVWFWFWCILGGNISTELKNTQRCRRAHSEKLSPIPVPSLHLYLPTPTPEATPGLLCLCPTGDKHVDEFMAWLCFIYDSLP